MKKTQLIKDVLESEGYDKQFNQSFIEFLRAEGFNGTLNRAHLRWLKDKGYTMNYNQAMKQWELADFAVGGSLPFSTARFWRVVFSDIASPGGTNYLWYDEVAFRINAGGGNTAQDGITGTASSNSEFSATLGASEAFDNAIVVSGTRGWSSLANPVDGDTWLQFEFDNPWWLVEVGFYPRITPTYNAETATLQVSSDGITWYTVQTYTGLTEGDASEQFLAVPAANTVVVP